MTAVHIGPANAADSGNSPAAVAGRWAVCGEPTFDSLPTIVGELHILFVKGDTVTENREHRARTQYVGVKSLFLEGIVLCQSRLIDQVHRFFHRIADVFVVRCESKKVMVEHFYMALGFHVQRFVHRRAGYEYRYISVQHIHLNKNNQVVGVVGGSYNVTKLGNMLFDDLFDGQGKSFIVDQDGNLITRDKKYEKKHNIKTIDNLFDICDEKEVKTDFNQQESDLIQIQTKKNKSLYLAYSPLKINDWMICYIVPVHVAQESYTFIKHYETLLATFLGLIVLSLMIYLAHSNSRENKYLIHLSEIDPLTSVFNKETTQKLIDQKLKNH